MLWEATSRGQDLVPFPQLSKAEYLSQPFSARHDTCCSANYGSPRAVLPQAVCILYGIAHWYNPTRTVSILTQEPGALPSNLPSSSRSQTPGLELAGHIRGTLLRIFGMQTLEMGLLRRLAVRVASGILIHA